MQISKCIIPCTNELLPLIQSFSIPYEYSCVELCSHFRNGPENFYILSNSTEPKSENEILGFFYLSTSLFICIPNLQTIFSSDEEFISVFEPYIKMIKDKKIHLLVGEENSCNYILKTLQNQNIEIRQTNEYKTLILKDKPFAPPESLSCDDFIKCCTFDDLDDLLPLQKNFLIKEVAIKGQKITDNDCKIMLANILKNQLVLALSSDSELVAKANTNAIGPNWIQLGGIYTDPLYRHNYYAWHLINALIERIQKNHKSVCLFVKQRNNPAIALYQKIGFTHQGNFIIAYF